jgi:phospholipid:diacylglycerol acyltransferase
MSDLRRRVFGDGTPPAPSREPTPDTTKEEVQLVAKSRLEELKRRTQERKPSKRRLWVIFLLGGLLGLFGAAFFADQQDVINLQGLTEFNFENFLDVIPAGIIKDAKDLTVSSQTARGSRSTGAKFDHRNTSAARSTMTLSP